MSNSVSSWNHWVENFPHTPQEFFKAVHTQLKSYGLQHAKPVLVSHGSGRPGKRLYMRISYQLTTVEIGAAPYGNGFFISYWVTKKPKRYPLAAMFYEMGGFFHKVPIPFLSTFFYKLFTGIAPLFDTKENNRFAMDEAFMFQQAVHRSILAVIQEHTAQEGTRRLPDYVAQPMTLTRAFE